MIKSSSLKKGECQLKTIQSYKTKLKDDILGAFKSRPEDLLGASDVFRILSERGVTLNITTVYRNLDAMTRDGVLLRFAEEDSGKALYKYSGEDGGCRDHLHLKCTECGEVIHLDCHFMKDLEEHVSLLHGFSLSCGSSMLLGKCKKCKTVSGE